MHLFLVLLGFRILRNVLPNRFRLIFPGIKEYPGHFSIFCITTWTITLYTKTIKESFVILVVSLNVFEIGYVESMVNIENCESG